MHLAGVRELFTYNAWANRACFAALEQVSAEAYVRDLKSSHGGLHGTVCHIVWAEELWLNRWLGRPNPAVPQGKDLPTLAAARARWEAIEAERLAFLAGFDEPRLAATLAVRPSSGGGDGPPFHQKVCPRGGPPTDHPRPPLPPLRPPGFSPPPTGLILFYRR